MVMKIFPKNNKGWIKVLEVFVSIMLVMGVIIFLLNKGYKTEEISEKVLPREISILREVQLNESLRTIVINADLPSNWSDFSSGNLEQIKNIIINKKLPNTECEAKICSLSEICALDTLIDGNIYSESAVISANKNNYSPRQLKIFCWEK